MKQPKFPKIGLALGSGSAKGFAHVGVIRTLEKHNIPIDYIAGSSVGAFIGAHYAVHKNINQVEDIIFNFDRKQGVRLIDWTIKGGLLKGKKMEEFISDALETDDFAQTQIPFTAVATDVHTAEAVILHKGNLPKAIRASISIPAFFQPIHIGKRILADGGLSNPVPVDVTKSMGADITIAVNLDAIYTENGIPSAPSLAKVPAHSINVLRHNLAKQSVKTADVIISPNDTFHIGIIGWGYFIDSEKAKEIIKMGEDAAEAAIPQIKNAIEGFSKPQSRWKMLKTFLRL